MVTTYGYHIPAPYYIHRYLCTAAEGMIAILKFRAGIVNGCDLFTDREVYIKQNIRETPIDEALILHHRALVYILIHLGP